MDALQRAPLYALALGFLFLIGGWLLASASPCTLFPGYQVCTPQFKSEGDILLVFGGIFLVLWVVLLALEEKRPK